jgi:ankyrin repeat protein
MENDSVLPSGQNSIAEDSPQQELQCSQDCIEPPSQEESLLHENENLKIVLFDLQQRLQNSQQLLSSQQHISLNLLNENSKQKLKLQQYELEINLNKNKLMTINKKQEKEKEFIKYENNKKKYETLQKELRLGMIDHEISNTKKQPMKLIKLKKNLDEIEKNQNSQKQLLTFLSLQEKLVEDLSSASQQNNLLECRNLIRRGVNVNEIDSAGFLPLHYACSAGSVTVVQLLLEFGSDYTSYLTGMSPMVLAADGGHCDVIRLLASFGANINETGVAGTPPIVAAAGKGHLQAVDTLLALHAFPDAQDIEGNAALHFAAKLEKPVPLLRTLLLHGANPKLLNGLGHTPLQVNCPSLYRPFHEPIGRPELSECSCDGNSWRKW